MSSFKSLNLFGSGPHRFAVAHQGQAISSELFEPNPASSSLYRGLTELQVVITGTLIAATEAGLWSLRDAITDQLLDPPEPGTLIDQHGREWADMSFIKFTPADCTNRGRVVSLEYEARFLKFRVYPQ